MSSPLIDRFKAKMAADMIARANRGNDVWPAPRVDLDASVIATAPPMTAALAEAFRRQILDESVRAFPYPSAVAQLMYLFMDAARDGDDAARRSSVADTMLGIIAHLRGGNPFCAGGVNNVGLPLAGRSPTPIDRSTARELGVLAALLNTYCEYAYFAFVAFGREIHGPYTNNAGDFTIMRDYYDLKPAFWNFPQSLDFSVLSLQVVYRDCDLKFDFMGRLVSTNSLPDHATAASLTIDGADVPVTTSLVRKLTVGIHHCLSQAFDETLSSSESSLLRRLVEAEYWTCRRLFSASGQVELAPLEGTLLDAIEAVYNELTGEGHCWLSSTLRQISRLDLEPRAGALRRLLDPGATEKRL